MRRLARTRAGLAVVIVLAACTAASTSPPPPTSTPAPTPAAPSPTPQVLACQPDPELAPLEVVPELLAILPADVDGIPIERSPDGEAAGLDDACLEVIASGFASGFAADHENFVFAVVAGLREPGSFSTELFRDWRDSFDEGACSQASGVGGHSETEIGGRTVYIGTCVGGLLTYHTWLEANGVLISASAVGERRLGELLVEHLRP